jgi:hypothetical protein
MVFTKTAVLAVLLAAVTVASAAVAEVKEEVSAAVHNVKADAAVHTGGYYGKPKPKPKHHYPKHPKYGGYGGYGGYGYSYRQAVERGYKKPRHHKHAKYGGYGGYGGYNGYGYY